MPVTPGFRRWRQEHSELKVIPCYIHVQLEASLGHRRLSQKAKSQVVVVHTSNPCRNRGCELKASLVYIDPGQPGCVEKL